MALRCEMSDFQPFSSLLLSKDSKTHLKHCSKKTCCYYDFIHGIGDGSSQSQVIPPYLHDEIPELTEEDSEKTEFEEYIGISKTVTSPI